MEAMEDAKAAFLLDSDISVREARRCIAAKDHDGARDWLAQALLADPGKLSTLLTLADMAARSGAVGNAVLITEVAVEQHPHDASGHRQLARCLRAATRLGEAVKSYEAALQLGPDDAATCFELAELHRVLGHPEESARCCQLAAGGEDCRGEQVAEAIAGMLAERRSGDAVALAAAVRNRFPASRPLALLEVEALLMDGRPSEALWCVDSLLSADERDDRAWRLRARALIGLARTAEASTALKRLPIKLTDELETLTLRATVLRLSGRGRAALDAYDRALAQAPLEARLHLGRAVVLRAQGLPREALAALGRAGDLAPDEAEVHYERAALLMALGRGEEAEEALLLARQGVSGCGGVLDMPITTELDLEQEVSLGDWKAVLEHGLLADGEKIAMLFAFANGLEAKGASEQAVDVLTVANAAVRGRLSFDADAYCRWLRRIPEMSTALVRRTPRPRVKAAKTFPVPIFVVGMPRSGTTLVEQVLAAHPQVRPAGESVLLPELLVEFQAEDAADQSYPDWLPALREDEAEGLRNAYLEAMAARFPRAGFVTDKLPGNFAHLGLIGALFPEARIVHCVRDPRDTCVSCYSQWFAQQHPYGYDLGEMTRVYNAYRSVMQAWREQLPVGAMFDQEYEGLVAMPEQEISRLLEYCGLPTNPGCFEAWRTARHIETASARRALLPIYQGSVGRWRQFEGRLGALEAELHAP